MCLALHLASHSIHVENVCLLCAVHQFLSSSSSIVVSIYSFATVFTFTFAAATSILLLLLFSRSYLCLLHIPVIHLPVFGAIKRSCAASIDTIEPVRLWMRKCFRMQINGEPRPQQTRLFHFDRLITYDRCHRSVAIEPWTGVSRWLHRAHTAHSHANTSKSIATFGRNECHLLLLFSNWVVFVVDVEKRTGSIVAKHDAFCFPFMLWLTALRVWRLSQSKYFVFRFV